MSWKVGRAPVVPGASHAFSVLVHSSATETKNGKTATVRIAERPVFYRVGQYIVQIATGRATATVKGKNVTTVETEGAYTRALQTKAATAAVALLQPQPPA